MEGRPIGHKVHQIFKNFSLKIRVAQIYTLRSILRTVKGLIFFDFIQECSLYEPRCADVPHIVVEQVL